MALKLLKQQAIDLRKRGYSYTQIKEKLGVSKSTLSGWLYNMPLSEKRVRELQADSPIRIERYRNTMRKKREDRLVRIYQEMAPIIGNISDRERFLCGLFLYWGEGTKNQKGTSAFTNTNPHMVKFFLKWLRYFNVPKEKLRVRLHLYSDMNIKKQEKYWSNELSIPISQFRKPYIKKTFSKDITYKNGFGQGTCSIVVGGTNVSEKIMMGIRYIQDTAC